MSAVLDSLFTGLAFEKKPAGRGFIYTIKDNDRVAAKQKFQQHLSSKKINFKDGIKSSSSLDLKTTDFMFGGDPVRVYYKPKRQSGAGADVTAAAECMQVYACYARQQAKKPLDTSEQLFDLLSKDQRGVIADISLDKARVALDDKWMYSSIAIANELYKELKGTYTFHRGGPVVDAVNNAFNRLKREAKFNLNINKWNPADIWICKQGFTPVFDDVVTLQELNNKLFDLFQEKTLIGVSLKKVERGRPTKEVFNDKPFAKKIKFNNFKIVSSGKDFFKDVISKDVYIEFTIDGSKNSMQIRTFVEGLTSWQGEIKGTSAAGGKVAGPSLEMALELSDVNLNKYIDQVTFKSAIKNKDVVVKRFATFVKSLLEDSRPLDQIENDVRLMFDKYTEGWLYSKFLGMQYIYYMLNSGMQDKITGNIVRIAKSATPLSSVFLKYS